MEWKKSQNGLSIKPVPAAENELDNDSKNLSLIQLKSIADKPELVQIDDCNTNDPIGLVLLREIQGQVDIPQHWRENKGRTRFPTSDAGYLPLPEEYIYAIKEYGKTQHQGFRSLAALARDEQREKNDQPIIAPINVYWKKQIYSQYGKPLNTKKLLSTAHRFTRGQISQELKEALGYKEGEEFIWDIRMKNLNLNPIEE